jgi:DNA invertase Pin-like site-specific DNA recombinase
MRIHIYTRSAAPDQRSIDTQMQQCWSKLKKLKATTITYHTDNGYSSLAINRPGLTELLDDIGKGKER